MTGQGKYQARNSQLDRGAHPRFCRLQRRSGVAVALDAPPLTLSNSKANGWRSTLTYRELWRGAVWNFALGMLVSVVPALAFYYLAFDYTPAQLRRLSWLAIPGMASVDLCGLFSQQLTSWWLGVFPCRSGVVWSQG